jgi:CarD family transcriptional regulator
MNYRVKQYVSYGGHGVGQIEKIVTMNGAEFYSVIILDSDLKILLPTSSKGLIRPLMDKFTAKTCREYISGVKKFETKSYSHSFNRRYREMMEKIKSNEPLQYAEVYSELTQRESLDELSFGERKLRDAALSLLNREIGLVDET